MVYIFVGDGGIEKIQSWQDEGEGRLRQADLSWIHDSQIVEEEKWLP